MLGFTTQYKGLSMVRIQTEVFPKPFRISAKVKSHENKSNKSSGQIQKSRKCISKLTPNIEKSAGGGGGQQQKQQNNPEWALTRNCFTTSKQEESLSADLMSGGFVAGFVSNEGSSTQTGSAETYFINWDQSFDDF